MGIFVAIILFALGAGLGSFACCQVWRIRKGDKSKWSHCMHCNYRLQWYDNVPIISWLALGGRCRKCRKKIGLAEILAEISMALSFVLSWMLWPEQEMVLAGGIPEIMRFVIFLLMLTCFCVCFIYDAKWQELPMVPVYISGALSILYLGTIWVPQLMTGMFELSELWSTLGGLLILPGFYFLMYKLSREKWVGGGDYILCIPIAIVLANFWLSLSTLFISNLIGCLIMLPVLHTRKNKDTKIALGPFLILGFLVVFSIKDFILEFVRI